nr:aldolase/citrate lyase family protein [Bhargavaea cecembensis]
MKEIMLPKTNDEHDLILVDRLLDSKGIGKDFEVIPLLETAAGIQNVSRIAAASSRVKRMAFGSIDFALDIGAGQSENGSRCSSWTR